MVRREADRARVLAEIVKTQGLDATDQHAEDATPAQEIPDGLGILAVDAVRDEALELVRVPVDDAEGGIARSCQDGGSLRKALEKLVEGQLGAQGDPGADEGPQPVVLVDADLAHAAIIRRAAA